MTAYFGLTERSCRILSVASRDDRVLWADRMVMQVVTVSWKLSVAARDDRALWHWLYGHTDIVDD